MRGPPQLILGGYKTNFVISMTGTDIQTMVMVTRSLVNVIAKLTTLHTMYEAKQKHVGRLGMAKKLKWRVGSFVGSWRLSRVIQAPSVGTRGGG